MRITFISPPVNMSGGIKVMAIYAKALAERGHNVSIISLPLEKISFITKLKSFLKGRGWISKPTTASHIDGLGLNHKVLERFRPITDHDLLDSDVVIATWWLTAEWVYALSDGKGAKVYFIQGHEVYSHLPVDRCRATYQLPLHKIVIARWLQDLMQTEYGNKVVDLVPNSVDHSQFFAGLRGKQPVPTLGFLYSPAQLKGVDITLKAIAKLRDQFPNLRVISFGISVPEGCSDFDSRIEFHHSPEQDSIRDLYAQCDVWVTTSRAEGFNLPAMEAMACRTPVVSTRTGWPEEAVVNSKNGYLVEVDDVETLTKCVYKVLSLSDEKWREMSGNAYETVKNSSWRTSTDLFEKALEHACQLAAKSV